MLSQCWPAFPYNAKTAKWPLVHWVKAERVSFSLSQRRTEFPNDKQIQMTFYLGFFSMGNEPARSRSKTYSNVILRGYRLLIQKSPTDVAVGSGNINTTKRMQNYIYKNSDATIWDHYPTFNIFLTPLFLFYTTFNTFFFIRKWIKWKKLNLHVIIKVPPFWFLKYGT
jgi:hypothetical protein